MQKEKIILETAQFNLTLERLSYRILEDYEGFADTCFVGIQTGGVFLGTLILEKLAQIEGKSAKNQPLGKLDITFYRDDFRTSKKPLAANINDMPFIIENQNVILFDDVLYTGRSVQAAMTALNHYGRPKSVKLVVMVDRRFNRQVPIRPDYVGISVDALDEAYIEVENTPLGNRVVLFSHQ
jgi:pyrimidine operon attenuation protein / uracil phosphoribosyltransferase